MELKTPRTLRTSQSLRHGSIRTHDKYKSDIIIVYVSAGCLAKQQVNRGARAFRKGVKEVKERKSKIPRHRISSRVPPQAEGTKFELGFRVILLYC